MYTPHVRLGDNPVDALKDRTTVFMVAMKEAMDGANLSQADIAVFLKLSPQYVSDVLRGKRGPFDLAQLLLLKKARKQFDLESLTLARAWTLKRIDIPFDATMEEVEEVLRILTYHHEASVA